MTHSLPKAAFATSTRPPVIRERQPAIHRARPDATDLAPFDQPIAGTSFVPIPIERSHVDRSGTRRTATVLGADGDGEDSRIMPSMPLHDSFDGMPARRGR